ncbi:MAG: TatD family hydrolase [Armatimonadetes bacterium]|nr:TatD family hydrolase [Armatimonadota bacterium]
MIDTHTHLNEPRFVEDLFVVRDRARDAGIERLIVVGYTLATSREALRVAKQTGDGAAVGIHPHDAAEATPEALETIRDLASSPPVVAIGETGLDFHYDHSPRETQIDRFRAHIRLAKACGLPLIMHCREAYEELYTVLVEEDAREAGGVVHCFWGTAEDARLIVDLGFYLGVGGGVTFPKSEELRQTLLTVPRNRILLETDCPYMAPLPYRGKRNEPAYLPYVAERLAQLYDAPVEKVVEETKENAFRCFPRLQRL